MIITPEMVRVFEAESARQAHEAVREMMTMTKDQEIERLREAVSQLRRDFIAERDAGAKAAKRVKRLEARIARALKRNRELEVTFSTAASRKREALAWRMWHTSVEGAVTNQRRYRDEVAAFERALRVELAKR